MIRYWVSWLQPGEDYRPLNFPPDDKIIGWWATGYSSNNMTTLCAFVVADNYEDAANAVLKDWPEATQNSWRSFETKDPEFVPNDRFPFAEWMQERLKKIEKET